MLPKKNYNKQHSNISTGLDKCLCRNFVIGLQNFKTRDPIPLKNIDVSVNIIDNVARVEYTQVYHNNSNLLLDTEYCFPISPGACFDSFWAYYDDKILTGVIKEKQQAQQQYKESVDQGKTVAYSEIIEDAPDVMKVKLGNIPPQADITIVIAYVEKIGVAFNKFWSFKLYSTITPRYTGYGCTSHPDAMSLSNLPVLKKNDKDAYPWKVTINIQSASPITFVKSHSHKIITEYTNEGHCCKVTLDPNMKYLPNKDFELLYINGKEGEPSYILTPTESGYCAMVTFFPQFEKISSDAAFASLQHAKKIETIPDMNKTRGEYIFLLDRSGSMKGARIQMAKEALSLFLKSLPVNSLYNVISFGNNFSSLHQESQKYQQNTLEKDLVSIESFEANMGGTNIYQPLSYIFNQKLNKTYPRYIFLLTDGGVTNTPQVLSLIKKNNTKARVFTVGIGNGCSPELITKGALFGKGKHEFVADGGDLMGKVISLLDSAMSPCVDDFKLEGDNFDALVESVSPNPATVPFLLRDQAVTFFLFLRSELSQVEKMKLNLKMFDSTLGDYRNFEIVLDVNYAEKNDMIPKLAIFDMMNRLEDNGKGLNSQDGDVYFAMKNDISKQLLNMSLQYGVLCSKTAFICEIDESAKNGGNIGTGKKSIIIPTIESVDYPIKNSPEIQSGVPMRRAAQSSMLENQCLGMPKISLAMPEGKALNMNVLKSPMLEKQCLGMPKVMSLAMPEGKTLNMNVLKKESFVNYGAKSKSIKCEKIQYSTSSGFDLAEDDEEFEMPSVSKPQSKTSGFLDVIKKQNIQGFWEDNDKNLLSSILKSDSLPPLPKGLASLSNGAKIWITILILCWLEKSYADQKNSWLLVHRKGYQWINSLGINIDEYKADALTALKT